MDNTREDKPATNAAAEEILSDEELDSVAGGIAIPNLNGDIWDDGTWDDGTGSGDSSSDSKWWTWCGGTGRG